jgi:hypothetical protein
MHASTAKDIALELFHADAYGVTIHTALGTDCRIMLELSTHMACALHSQQQLIVSCYKH